MPPRKTNRRLAPNSSAASARPELLALPPAEDGRRRALNSTAYRIFKLLAWLMREALSVEALNAKFQTDPLIGRTLSSDSIWLYINTLKALGCRIRRPCPSNGFRYELLYHPFGLQLNEGHLETLALAKTAAQRHFSHEDMQVLDGLIKKVIRHSICQNPQTLIDQLFARSRSLDTDDLRQLSENLESWIRQSTLLRLTYLSPLKGEECFDFLPETLLYEQGVLYLRGDRPEYDGPSSLRADRILSAVPREDKPLCQSLLARRSRLTEIRLRLFADNPEDFDGFGLDPRHGVYRESVRWQPEADRPHFEVTLLARDTFYLKQRLLSGGCPFAIQQPAELRDELRQALEHLQAFYATDTPWGEEIHDRP